MIEFESVAGPISSFEELDIIRFEVPMPHNKDAKCIP
jgi:hypothetical protein